MKLPPEQVERFYAIWFPLMLFVNRRLKLVPEMLAKNFDGPWLPNQVIEIRDALWADDSLREAFIAENPAKLSPADLAIVESWRYREPGPFYVFRHLKKYSVLIKDRDVYGVLGLASTLDEVIPFTPCYAQAVLLPFEGGIIYDSLIVPYNVMFGKGIRSELQATYQDARERGAIITALGPDDAQTPEERAARIQTTNAKVLDAFRAGLFAAGLSVKVVERDLANAAAFAEHLSRQRKPLSLREFGTADLQRFLAKVGAKVGPTRTTLKRFVRFLRDTQRLDYEVAEDALDVLKEKS